MKKTLLSLCILLCSPVLFASDMNKIAATADLVSPLLIGQTIPDVTLYDIDDKPINLKQLVAQKPTVLVFYRGGWCPYCNAQLAGLREVETQIMAQGYQLVAISPDSPERLKAQKMKTEYQIVRLSDKHFDAISAFGIGFFLPEKTAHKYRDKLGVQFVDLDGSNKVALPVPAIYVADQQGLVHFNYVNPNFRVRLDPQLLFQATKTLAL